MNTLLLFDLVVCVIDVLDEASDGRFHQHQECELPGQTHHQGDHAYSLDECPQQNVGVQSHCHPHLLGVFRQPGGDVTCDSSLNKKLSLFCVACCVALQRF